jgi:hypothetical protein
MSFRRRDLPEEACTGWCAQKVLDGNDIVREIFQQLRSTPAKEEPQLDERA